MSEESQTSLQWEVLGINDLYIFSYYPCREEVQDEGHRMLLVRMFTEAACTLAEYIRLHKDKELSRSLCEMKMMQIASVIAPRLHVNQ